MGAKARAHMHDRYINTCMCSIPEWQRGHCVDFCTLQLRPRHDGINVVDYS